MEQTYNTEDLWFGLSSEVRESFKKAGLCTAKAILVTPVSEICISANISEDECKTVCSNAAKLILKQGFFPVMEIKHLPQHSQRLTVGCHKLDSFLNGGIPLRGITELTGESGSGKTQLCLQMSLAVQLCRDMGGFSAGCVYICTEHAFPSSRLQQLISTFPSRVCLQHDSSIRFGDNIFLQHIPDMDRLEKCLKKQIPKLMQQHEIKLLIIDSIAGVFRAVFTKHDVMNWATRLRAVGGELHHLAHEYNLAVVVANQVTELPGICNDPVPALGLTWANMITTRLQLFRLHSESLRRMMRVCFSPELPLQECLYTINETGVVGCETVL